MHLGRLPPHVLRRRLDVGHRIRQARLAARLSQGSLGERVGVDHKTISRIENGVTSVKVDLLLAIADALGISPRVLLPERAAPGPGGHPAA